MEWLNDCKEALVAMAEIYEWVQILDLETGSDYLVKVAGSMEQASPKEQGLQNRLDAMLAAATVHGSHQEVADFIQLATLANRLHGLVPPGLYPDGQ